MPINVGLRTVDCGGGAGLRGSAGGGSAGSCMSEGGGGGSSIQRQTGGASGSGACHALPALEGRAPHARGDAAPGPAVGRSLPELAPHSRYMWSGSDAGHCGASSRSFMALSPARSFVSRARPSQPRCQPRFAQVTAPFRGCERREEERDRHTRAAGGAFVRAGRAERQDVSSGVASRRAGHLATRAERAAREDGLPNRRAQLNGDSGSCRSSARESATRASSAGLRGGRRRPRGQRHDPASPARHRR